MATNKDENNGKKPKSVLVARFSAIGDVALSIPVMYSVCRCYPETDFIFVTRHTMTPIFVNAPENLHLLGVNIKKEYAGMRGMYRLFGELRARHQIDVFVDLHNVLRTCILALLFRLHGIRVKQIDKGRSHKRALTRNRNKRMLPLVSSRARYRETFYRAGLPIVEKFNGVYSGEPSDQALFAEISAPKKEGEHWVGIAPFAKHQGKIYPLKLMEKVIARLTLKDGVKIFLFGGGEKERAILKEWAGKYPDVTSLAEKLYGFDVEMALMNHLDVMLSMDSANMHLASISGCTVVSVWGATHPYCGFKGWRQTESNTVQLSMTCRPCSVFGNKPCRRGDYLCLSGISPQTIIDKIEQIIGKS